MKNLFTILNLFLIVAIGFCIVDTGYKNLIPQNHLLPENKTVSSNMGSKPFSQKSPDIDKNMMQNIVKRNLFKAEVEAKQHSTENHEQQEKQEQNLDTIEPTTLKLLLWGTVTGSNNSNYAVIEDQTVKKQALYQIDDLIQEAKLIKILRNRVILSYQGKEQLLEIHTNKKQTSKNNPATAFNDLPEFNNLKEKFHKKPVSADRIMGHNISQNFDQVMKQIKFRPHFSQGEADGLMVYGIKPNSVFRKIGLRNGDIVKDINDTIISSKEDVSNMLNDFDNLENLKLTVLRKGKTEELVYNPFMTNPFSKN